MASAGHVSLMHSKILDVINQRCGKCELPAHHIFLGKSPREEIDLLYFLPCQEKYPFSCLNSLIPAHLRSSTLEKRGQRFRVGHPYPPRCSRAFDVLTACIALFTQGSVHLSLHSPYAPHYSVRVSRFESRGPSESPGRSPRIRHRHALTEKAWENALQGRGNVSHRKPGSQCLRFSF